MPARRKSGAVSEPRARDRAAAPGARICAFANDRAGASAAGDRRGPYADGGAARAFRRHRFPFGPQDRAPCLGLTAGRQAHTGGVATGFRDEPRSGPPAQTPSRFCGSLSQAQTSDRAKTFGCSRSRRRPAAGRQIVPFRRHGTYACLGLPRDP